MSDQLHEGTGRRLWRLRRLRQLYARHRNSEATLGVAMALIAMLFIAGIVTAFIHAADTNPAQRAQNIPPIASAPAETTGAGDPGQQ